MWTRAKAFFRGLEEGLLNELYLQVISRPGQSQGLLYRHCCDSLIDQLKMIFKHPKSEGFYPIAHLVVEFNWGGSATNEATLSRLKCSAVHFSAVAYPMIYPCHSSTFAVA